VLRFFVFLLFMGVAGGAFYAGMRYQQGRLFGSVYRLFSSQNAAPQPSPATQPLDAAAAFAQRRSAVDSDPKKWLEDNLSLELAKEGIAKATDSKDPEFLYLYGRALMLTGNHRDAMPAFELAINNLRTEQEANLPLGAEVRLAEAAAALKLKKQSPAGTSQELSMAEQRAARILDELLNVKTEGTSR
jgi:hypothetical protein